MSALHSDKTFKNLFMKHIKMEDHDYGQGGAQNSAQETAQESAQGGEHSAAGGSRQGGLQGGAAHAIDRFVHEDPMVSGADADVAKRQAMLEEKGYFERGNCYYVGRGDEDEARLVTF